MTTTGILELRQVPLDHPDGAALIAQVQEYYADIYGGPDAAPTDTYDFMPPRGRFFLGYLLSNPVAMGGWRFHAGVVEMPCSRPAEVKRMYVVPAVRGQSLARLLLSHLEQTALDAGADAMVLETGYIQRDAIRLYRAAGYTDVPPFGHYAGVRGALHLGKTLSAGGLPGSAG